MQQQINQHILFDADHIFSDIKGKTIAEKSARLSVYKNNVFHSLTEALQEIFPLTQTMLGEVCFKVLCCRYISDSPQAEPILSKYGHQFASHLAKQSELADYPYLSELANLEYQLLQLTHQQESVILTPADIAQKIDTEIKSIEHSLWDFAPYIDLMELAYPIGTLYQHLTENEDANIQIDWSKKEWLVLCKSALWGTFYSISEQEWQMLKQLQAGSSLSEATQYISEEEWVPMLQSMIQKPLFTAVR